MSERFYVETRGEFEPTHDAQMPACLGAWVVRDFPVVPAHEPRTEAQRRADTSGRPQRWRKRVVYPANRPGLTRP